MNRWSSSSQRIALIAALGSLFVGCLPKDTRPVPASVLVQASSDDALRVGFTTDDGWHVTYNRFLMTIGNSAIDGDHCNSYAEGGYTRALDLQQNGPQKVNLMYGLGTCDFSFTVNYPRADSITGTGVTANEVLMMRTAGADAYTPPGVLTGISAYVVGTATNGNQTKSFTWPFRLPYFFQSCAKPSDAGSVRGLNLSGQEATSVELLVRGETLFQNNVDPNLANVKFAPFEAADSQFGDNDGQITLDELRLVPITQLDSVDGGAVMGGYVPDGSVGTYVPGAFELSVPDTLGDFVYSVLVPASVRYQDTGACFVSTARPNRRD